MRRPPFLVSATIAFLAFFALGDAAPAHAQAALKFDTCICYMANPDAPDDPDKYLKEIKEIDEEYRVNAENACKLLCPDAKRREVEQARVADCPPGYDAKGTRCLKNPLQVKTFPELIGRILNAALGTVGSLALLMFIYGGFLWLTSGGSADKISKGKQIMTWAGLGLILIFASYALVRFVLAAFTKL